MLAVQRSLLGLLVLSAVHVHARFCPPEVSEHVSLLQTRVLAKQGASARDQERLSAADVELLKNLGAAANADVLNELEGSEAYDWNHFEREGSQRSHDPASSERPIRKQLSLLESSAEESADAGVARASDSSSGEMVEASVEASAAESSEASVSDSFEAAGAGAKTTSRARRRAERSGAKASSGSHHRVFGQAEHSALEQRSVEELAAEELAHVESDDREASWDDAEQPVVAPAGPGPRAAAMTQQLKLIKPDNYDVEEGRKCGDCDDDNDLSIGKGGKAYDVATRSNAGATCGKVCDAEKDCGGFNFAEAHGLCYYRKVTWCEAEQDADRDCYSKNGNGASGALAEAQAKKKERLKAAEEKASHEDSQDLSTLGGPGTVRTKSLAAESEDDNVPDTALQEVSGESEPKTPLSDSRRRQPSVNPAMWAENQKRDGDDTLLTPAKTRKDTMDAEDWADTLLAEGASKKDVKHILMGDAESGDAGKASSVPFPRLMGPDWSGASLYSSTLRLGTNESLYAHASATAAASMHSLHHLEHLDPIPALDMASSSVDLLGSGAAGVAQRLAGMAEDMGRMQKALKALEPHDARRASGSARHLPPFAFIKTHRTASSTVANILHRLGDARNLTFMLPPTVKGSVTSGLGWPRRFPGADVASFNGAPANQHDIICDNAVFNEDAMRAYLKPSPFFFTTLRRPVAQLQSSFGFYAPASANSSWSERINWLERLWFDEGVASLGDRAEALLAQFRNPQAHDLGWYDHVGGSSVFDQDDRAVQAWLGGLEASMSLVLIAEHLDEGLVLLGRRAGIRPKELAHLSLAAGVVQPAPTAEQAMRIEEALHVDSLLYGHFNRTFWHSWAAAGGDAALGGELRELRRRSEELERACRNGEDAHCPAGSRLDGAEFTNILKKKQLRQWSLQRA